MGVCWRSLRQLWSVFSRKFFWQGNCIIPISVNLFMLIYDMFWFYYVPLETIKSCYLYFERKLSVWCVFYSWVMLYFWITRRFKKKIKRILCKIGSFMLKKNWVKIIWTTLANVEFIFSYFCFYYIFYSLKFSIFTCQNIKFYFYYIIIRWYRKGLKKTNKHTLIIIRVNPKFCNILVTWGII